MKNKELLQSKKDQIDRLSIQVDILKSNLSKFRHLTDELVTAVESDQKQQFTFPWHERTFDKYHDLRLLNEKLKGGKSE